MPHCDLEFHVQRRGSDDTEIFPTWDEATRHLDGAHGTIDVCVWSEAGARAYGGDDAAEIYAEDPDASVHERWVTSKKDPRQFDCLGRVP